MTKGGHARSGPPPDPNALRRERDRGEWSLLPAAGRPGDAPVWPLLGLSERETDLWADLWRKPQALMWERYGQELEVALYVRRLVEAEEPRAPVTLGTLIRQQADSLGLTTPGLRSNRWRIVAAVPAEAVPAPSKAAPKRTASRDRFKVVRDDADEE
ncbi:hypothetical protein [Actinomadura rubrisoli]|uniref:Terminase small subunit n=1 Tax=Actinomadura rubrisoli TaxID=2530368 RepID=A0A4R5BQW9_9ACTN|nr:hypothetical protein [Actinomadura rubrisoli]TDD88365.1 hypothetical protein E1298_15255 [Actinomadura rubrisoli]